MHCGIGLCGHVDAPLSRFPDKNEVGQLYAEVCAEPAEQVVDEDGERYLICRPRDYPRDPIDGDSRCALRFKSDGNGRFDIFYGHFSAPRPQAIAMYQGGCEPHAGSYGGMALLDVTDGKFKLVRYDKGHVYTDCVTVPAKQEARDTPYCQSWYSQNGGTYEAFGPVKFPLSGGAQFEEWFHAESGDGAYGPVDNCDGETKAHHLTALHFDRSTRTIVLEAAMRDPKVVAEACRRYFAEEFDAEDRSAGPRCSRSKTLGSSATTRRTRSSKWRCASIRRTTFPESRSRPSRFPDQPLTTGATLRAMPSTRLSAIASPISMKPTGSSPSAWQGRLMAQRSRKLPTVVLRSSSMFLRVKPSGVETSSRVGATIAQLGMMIAS